MHRPVYQDPKRLERYDTLILAELTFLQQEFQFCNDADTITRSNLTQAIHSFEDALRCLKTVENAPGYPFCRDRLSH
ncbi:MAG: hypothetical protein LBT14_03525 [Treponema sp.]|nr:hypothetical protein [Treponema sp.]